MPTNSKCHENNENKFWILKKEINSQPTKRLIINTIKESHRNLNCYVDIKIGIKNSVKFLSI